MSAKFSALKLNAVNACRYGVMYSMNIILNITEMLYDSLNMIKGKIFAFAGNMDLVS